jgi:hypothetical protein
MHPSALEWGIKHLKLIIRVHASSPLVTVTKTAILWYGYEDVFLILGYAFHTGINPVRFTQNPVDTGRL